MKKTVAELFAGVGGFRVGLNNIRKINIKTGKAIEEGNWDFVWANQWEPSTKNQDAYNCYITRFEAEDVSNKDIGTVDKNSIPNHNLLVGGFPCQDYSVARSISNEKGIEGKKGVLFWEIVETLEKKETPFFLLENVDRLLKSPASQRGRDFGIMIRTLTDLGYDLEWRVINAAEYGRGQKRRRVFIFGWKKVLNYSQKINESTPKELISNDGFFAKSFPITDIGDDEEILQSSTLDYKDTVVMTQKYAFKFENSGIVIDGLIHTIKTKPIIVDAIPLKENLEKSKAIKDYIISEKKLEKFEYLRKSKKVKRKKPNGDIYYYTEGSMSVYDSIELPARTMLTSERGTNRSTHIIKDPILNKVRYITPIEAERLQDFPDSWTDTGMSIPRRYFTMGNALVTGIVTQMEPVLSEIFDNEK